MLLSEAEAARYLALSPRTLERWRSTGEGPRYCKQSRRIAYRREDLDAWIAAHMRSNTSERSAA
jgi:predicted DNA-binding transcriptional regulator AlpA